MTAPSRKPAFLAEKHRIRGLTRPQSAGSGCIDNGFLSGTPHGQALLPLRRDYWGVSTSQSFALPMLLSESGLRNLGRQTGADAW